MLTMLHIENIAVIDCADVPFGEGLNVLTGETGAGKSIVIDSIGALLGARVGKDLLRRGESRARVTGLFTELSEMVVQGLRELGIDTEDGELLLERTLTADGKTAARAGGKPVTSALLRSAAPFLLNIHGQHDTGKLLSDATHLSFIDRCGACGDLLAAYREKYSVLREIDRELSELALDDAEKARRSDNLRYHIEKLEAAKLSSGEDERLESRRTELRAAESNRAAAARASEALSGTDDLAGAVALLREAARALGSGEGETAETLAQALNDLSYEAEDIAERVADLSFSVDPAELDAIEGRLYTLDRLKRRYGQTVREMLDYLAHAKAELEAIDSADARIAELTKRREDALEAASAAADVLHARRTEAADTLSRAIERELTYLDMPRAKFRADLAAAEDKKLGPDGYDKSAFLIAVNAGEDLKPLSKVASGGELSRVMLALQNVLSAGDDAQTLVFDEVDAGISGRAAGKVARKLRELAHTRQILCVTHLASLAAAGHHELFIRKTEADGRTFTRIDALDTEGRAREIARLLAGENISETVLGAARELLSEYSENE
ncbi:MAG: DNA repair protein RecN [Clostridiaceae bacterium]|nr:DNA repair protein RecN [Clostridiaceae bacterium]